MEIKQSQKKQKYEELLSELGKFFTKYESKTALNKIARMCSICSAIKLKFSDFKFVGFYTVEKKHFDNNNNSIESCNT